MNIEIEDTSVDIEVAGTSMVESNHASLSNLDYANSGHTGFQATLTSGTNIKTINNESILGSGNISVSAGVDDVKVDGTSVVSNKVANIDLTTKLNKATPTSEQGTKEYLYTFAGSTQKTDVALINDMTSGSASYTDAMVPTAKSVAIALANKDLSTKEDVFRYSTMPTAEASLTGKIVEYIGTTGTYTNGYFYKCTETTAFTPASLSITTSGTAGLGTVTGNVDTFGDAVYDNEEDAYTFEYRAYPDNITVVTASDGNKTLSRNRVGDTNGRYAWLMYDNSTVYTETQVPELGTEFFSTATEDSTTFISYDDVTINEYSDTYGRWQLDYGDDIYEDVDLSEYGISYNGVALIGAKITVQYTDDIEGSNTYIWQQVNTQPATEIVNNVTSTDTSKALSANMGKTLQDEIDNLKARGRFLALWNATTGLAESNPATSPYTYKTGDYFIVGTVGTTNYKPTGTSYVIGTASTTVETETLAVDDVYYYDGTSWKLQINTQKTVSFANIAGQPSDNTNLASALNNKVGFTDYATNSSAGVIKGGRYGMYIADGSPYSPAMSYSDYTSTTNTTFISKGTLENVLVGKGIVDSNEVSY